MPRVTGPAEMHFYKITSMKDVALGYYDIPEPLENCQEEVFEGFLVVPGTAFDRQMHRMGYGGGFYDVWLKRHGSHVTACGLAYDFQLRNEIPFERHDRMMNIVITPDEVIRKGDAAGDNDRGTWQKGQTCIKTYEQNGDNTEESDSGLGSTGAGG